MPRTISGKLVCALPARWRSDDFWMYFDMSSAVSLRLRSAADSMVPISTHRSAWPLVCMSMYSPSPQWSVTQARASAINP